MSDDVGQCRRFPPVHTNDDCTSDPFPYTREHEWCGEWAEDKQNNV